MNPKGREERREKTESPIPNPQLVSVLLSMNQGGFLEPVFCFFPLSLMFLTMIFRSKYIYDTDMNPG